MGRKGVSSIERRLFEAINEFKGPSEKTVACGNKDSIQKKSIEDIKRRLKLCERLLKFSNALHFACVVISLLACVLVIIDFLIT